MTDWLIPGQEGEVESQRRPGRWKQASKQANRQAAMGLTALDTGDNGNKGHICRFAQREALGQARSTLM